MPREECEGRLQTRARLRTSDVSLEPSATRPPLPLQGKWRAHKSFQQVRTSAVYTFAHWVPSCCKAGGIQGRWVQEELRASTETEPREPTAFLRAFPKARQQKRPKSEGQEPQVKHILPRTNVQTTQTEPQTTVHGRSYLGTVEPPPPHKTARMKMRPTCAAEEPSRLQHSSASMRNRPHTQCSTNGHHLVPSMSRRVSRYRFHKMAE